MLIDIPKKFLDALERGPPFSSDVGWYPYVRIYGHVRRTYSPDIAYPVLQYSWMEYRKPKNPAQAEELIADAYADADSNLYLDSGFAVNKSLQLDLLLFLQVLRVMQKALGRTLSQLRPSTLDLAKDAYSRLSPEYQKIIPTSDRL